MLQERFRSAKQRNYGRFCEHGPIIRVTLSQGVLDDKARGFAHWAG